MLILMNDYIGDETVHDFIDYSQYCPKGRVFLVRALVDEIKDKFSQRRVTEFIQTSSMLFYKDQIHAHLKFSLSLYETRKSYDRYKKTLKKFIDSYLTQTLDENHGRAPMLAKIKHVFDRCPQFVAPEGFHFRIKTTVDKVYSAYYIAGILDHSPNDMMYAMMVLVAYTFKVIPKCFKKLTYGILASEDKFLALINSCRKAKYEFLTYETFEMFRDTYKDMLAISECIVTMSQTTPKISDLVVSIPYSSIETIFSNGFIDQELTSRKYLYECNIVGSSGAPLPVHLVSFEEVTEIGYKVEFIKAKMKMMESQ